MRIKTVMWCVALGCSGLLACNGDLRGSGTDAAGSGGGTDAGSMGLHGDAAADARPRGPDSGSGGADAASAPPMEDAWTAPPMPTHLCAMPRPSGAPMPAPLAAYSGGACPALVPGSNTVTTSGASRTFILVVPTDAREGERLPVSFLWHPLGSEADVYLTGGVLQDAADRERFIAVLPQAKGDLTLRWPSTGGGGRVDEEVRFFDDMLACVAAQWTVNTDCVATGGVSAGALWSNRLANARADRLSSFISVSGGTGGAFPGWSSVGHRLPALVIWGGPTDTCGPFSFEGVSRNLTGSLSRDGHAIIECVHNCGHALPPFEMADPFLPIVQFGLNHPFWLGRGETPYSAGLPDTFPSWCGLGAGSATRRTGMCAAPSAC
ncbi:MAG: hypothetical protein ACK5U8_23920 [Deltaproteobacteria bacterium]|jgi:hypothetical protein